MPTILVVDDAQFMRLRVTRLLNEYGYDVIEAADGDMAVQSYRLHRPDAVLMDITMPGKDGLAALTEIRAFDPQARVIMLTALGQQATVLRAMQAGAKDFLVKPYDPDRIITAVRKVLK